MRLVLETERLVLREMAPEDLDFVAIMLSDPKVMQFYPRPLPRPEAEEWLKRQRSRYAEHGHGLWLAVEKSSRQPVGQVGLVRQQVEGRPEPEIGYLLHRSFWHRGFATEAGLGVLDYAFDTLGHSRVISLIRPANLPSQAVARRLGMLPVREVRFHGLPHLVFSIARNAREADSPPGAWPTVL
jgi:ribosomal-protein-alanine N-acetyltransferase